MGKKLTQEEVIQKVKIANPNIKILGKYEKNNVRIECECLISECGHKWYAFPLNLFRGTGCPKCGKIEANIKESLTHDEFILKLQKVNPYVKILGKYQRSNIKIECKCLKDGYIWSAKPNNLLQGKGCPQCAGNRKINHNEFVDRIHRVNSDIEIIDKYVNLSTKMRYKCIICDNIWEARADHLLNGHGCPKCKCSKGEQAISRYLDNNKINYISQYRFNDCRNILPLPFDFYLPQYNVCIEYDGEQHYLITSYHGVNEDIAKEKLNKRQKLDDIKTRYCQENNIKLFRIPYWEFDNIENILKKELCKGGGGEYA